MALKFLSVLLVLCVVQYGETARWSHSVMLSPNYRFLWSLGPGPEDVTFELQVRTLGYVGFGFSKDGRMAGADVVVGWVDKGQVYFQDRHVKDFPGNLLDMEPEVDPSQDYQLLLGYENNTHTVLRFRRKLNTCDHHDIPITNDTMRIIWAFHTDDPIDGSVGPKSLPTQNPEFKGKQSLYLVQRADLETLGPEETSKIWELRNSLIEPPLPGENLYWCSVFTRPTITTKHHLIRYEPLRDVKISNGLQQVVLYECEESSQVTKLADTPGRQCHESDTQPLSCNTVVVSWARGSEGFSFPPEAGYPLDPFTSRYYLLETHYVSPTDGSLESLDGSGLRLYYTPEIRRHDAGVLSIGIDPNWRHIIPPGQQRVVSSGHCVSECTKRAFSNEGINIFAVVLKTHRIGRQIVLKHIRNGVEQPPIAADDNLDSDYQEYRRLEVPVKVMPGDHLIAECTYNSSGRTAITLGGLTSREETCIVVGLYYPKQRSLAACHSLPSLPTVLHSLGIQELNPGSNPVRISAPPELAGMTLESRLVSYDWNNHFYSFQDATTKGSFKSLCWTTRSTILPKTDKELHYPNVTTPYIRSNINPCKSYRKYSTKGWTGGSVDVEGNHVEGPVRSIVSRSSSSPAAEESLGLSRVNSACSRNTFQNLLIICALLTLFTQ